MRFLKKFLLGLFSAIFLLGLSSTIFADPNLGDDDPNPPPVAPWQS